MAFDWCSFLLGGLLFWLLAWLLDWLFSGQRQSQQVAKLADLNTQLEGVGRERSRLESELSSKLGVLGTVEGELSALKTRLPKLEGFERANADLRLQLQGFDTVKQKLQTAETELVGLRLKATEFDGLSTKFEAVQQEFSGLKTKTAGFEGYVAKASEASDLATKLAALESEKAKHLEELKTMSVKVSDSEHAQGKLRGSLDESLAEISRLREGIRAFEGLRVRIEDLEQRGVSHEAQAKIDAAETEMGAYKERISQLEGKLQSQSSDFEQQAQGLRSQLEGAGQNNAELAELRGQLETAKQNHQNEIGGFLALAGAGGLVALQQKISGLQGQLEVSEGERVGLRGRIALLESQLSSQAERPDQLEDVNGIGAVIAKKLEAAGISRFAQLAQTSPERLHEIVQPKEFQKFDFAAWAEDAAYLARGEQPPKRERQIEQKLSRIDGIGEVTEQKLEAAGIKTYAELEAASDEAIHAALGHHTDPDELELWRAEAQALAQGKSTASAREQVQKLQLERRETEMRRLQSELRQAESQRRDRFDLITGLGDAAMRKLYGAGLYLYSELAAASPEAIQAVLERDDLDYAQIQREAAVFAVGGSVETSSETIETSKEGE